MLPRLAAVFVAALASRAAGQEFSDADFSQARLREGKEAYVAKRPIEAINQLRVAAFGFLDRPALLCQSLVYLALACEAAERHKEAQATVGRLSDIEGRFVPCAEASLDRAVRSEFESKFHLRLPVAMPAAAAPKTPTPRPPASTPTPRPKS